MICDMNENQANGSVHSGHLHFATKSSVPGCGGHLQIFEQSTDGGVELGVHPQVHSVVDSADIVVNAMQMLMMTANTKVKFILIISL